jgi:hypothetical protein
MRQNRKRPAAVVRARGVNAAVLSEKQYSNTPAAAPVKAEMSGGAA